MSLLDTAYTTRWEYPDTTTSCPCKTPLTRQLAYNYTVPRPAEELSGATKHCRGTKPPSGWVMTPEGEDTRPSSAAVGQEIQGHNSYCLMRTTILLQVHGFGSSLPNDETDPEEIIDALLRTRRAYVVVAIRVYWGTNVLYNKYYISILVYTSVLLVQRVTSAPVGQAFAWVQRQ